ncbi:Threonine/homoserine/homoserine lactone efflux protein [Nitrosomonas sp. Nm51]|uniref:LysE family translocator n=1 Tax=Nitrosomonas sp. Nm51 TaxID=133720 RepID=UPI0008C9F010|nr:LysE family transporter [Nitrosomonas sp. Nm51]SER30348.1 Threonine/homoserine/homoserine lactone efflux protein [Nitrosomonas sp. Nm51]
MSLFDVSALVIVMITLAAMPSTSVALVVARSATMNLVNGVAVSMGIVLGDLIFVGLALLGLTTLSELMGGFFLAVKVAAGMYLIWFGINLIRSRTKNLTCKYSGTDGGLPASFLAGLFVTLGDVKAIFFYASLFPAIIDISALTLPDIAAILFITAATVGGVKLAYAFAATKVMVMNKELRTTNKTRLVSALS